MFKKLLSFVLVGLVMQVGFTQSVAANPNPEKEAQLAERVKAGIARLGVGEGARVQVKLRDKRKLKGYVSEANAESFTVVDAKTGAATQVAYPQVKTVKGNNLSEGEKALIFLGVVAAAIIVSVVVFAGN